MLRRVLFRLHWLIGLSASVVLAVVGISGTKAPMKPSATQTRPGTIKAARHDISVISTPGTMP